MNQIDTLIASMIIILGEKVNIEVDVLAKMVERSLAGVYEGKGQSNSDAVIAALEARVAKLEAALLKIME